LESDVALNNSLEEDIHEWEVKAMVTSGDFYVNTASIDFDLIKDIKGVKHLCINLYLLTDGKIW
jgi:hypothetical protein